MSKRLLISISLLVIALLIAGCGALSPKAPANTEPAPVVPPPATAVPPTAVPATAVPPTKEAVVPTEKPAVPANGAPAGCVDVLTITKDQIGQSLCVWGIVEKDANLHGDYYLYFKGANKDTLFFLGTAWSSVPVPGGYAGARAGDCVYLENKKINQFGQALLVYFTSKELNHCAKQ